MGDKRGEHEGEKRENRGGGQWMKMALGWKVKFICM